MNVPNAADPADRLGPRQLAAWSVFAALLALGLAFWYLYSARIIPMLDLLTDR